MPSAAQADAPDPADRVRVLLDGLVVDVDGEAPAAALARHRGEQ